MIENTETSIRKDISNKVLYKLNNAIALCIERQPYIPINMDKPATLHDLLQVITYAVANNYTYIGVVIRSIDNTYEYIKIFRGAEFVLMPIYLTDSYRNGIEDEEVKSKCIVNIRCANTFAELEDFLINYNPQESRRGKWQ